MLIAEFNRLEKGDIVREISSRVLWTVYQVVSTPIPSDGVFIHVHNQTHSSAKIFYPDYAECLELVKHSITKRCPICGSLNCTRPNCGER